MSGNPVDVSVQIPHDDDLAQGSIDELVRNVLWAVAHGGSSRATTTPKSARSGQSRSAARCSIASAAMRREWPRPGRSSPRPRVRQRAPSRLPAESFRPAGGATADDPATSRPHKDVPADWGDRSPLELKLRQVPVPSGDNLINF
jgi:hypothetical protein